MAQSAIDEILKKKQGTGEPEPEGDRFFSILLGEGLFENFLELQFRDGSRTCFSYNSLTWFNLSPEDGIDLDFSGYLVSIKGRGMEPKLWNGLKAKRVAWVKEADVELQDHKGNECYIEGITITPPEGFGGDETAEE